MSPANSSPSETPSLRIGESPLPAKVARIGHFTGACRRQGGLEGNISIFWFEPGWSWFIPLAARLEGATLDDGAVYATAP